MKRFISTLIALLIIGTSQASTTQNGIVNSKKSLVSVARPKTVTLNAPGRASVLRTLKPKFFTGNPRRITAFVNDWDDDYIEVDDIITTYRRRDLQNIQTDASPNNPEALDENIRWKLFLVRQLAMLKYREIHS